MSKFPSAVMSMSSVQWLNLNRVKLNEIPEEIGKLGKLVCISVIFMFLYFVLYFIENTTAQQLFYKTYFLIKIHNLMSMYFNIAS